MRKLTGFLLPCETRLLALQYRFFYRAKQPFLENKKIGFARVWQWTGCMTATMAKNVYTMAVQAIDGLRRQSGTLWHIGMLAVAGKPTFL